MLGVLLCHRIPLRRGLLLNLKLGWQPVSLNGSSSFPSCWGDRCTFMCMGVFRVQLAAVQDRRSVLCIVFARLDEGTAVPV